LKQCVRQIRPHHSSSIQAHVHPNISARLPYVALKAPQIWLTSWSKWLRVLCRLEPNQGMELTASSVCSSLTPVSSSSSCLAFSRQDKLGVSCKVKVLVG